MKTFFTLLLVFLIGFTSYSQEKKTNYFRTIGDTCKVSPKTFLGKSVDEVTFIDGFAYNEVYYSIKTFNDIIIYSTTLSPIDSSCCSKVHKLYYFKNDICVKMVCNYLDVHTKTCYLLSYQSVDYLPEEKYSALMASRNNP